MGSSSMVSVSGETETAVEVEETTDDVPLEEKEGGKTPKVVEVCASSLPPLPPAVLVEQIKDELFFFFLFVLRPLRPTSKQLS